MKKKNTIITLASAMAFLCVGGAFALNANTSVSADTTKKQIMLGASVLVTDGEAGKDANGIRFPVVVEDSVAEAITKSTTYVLPAHLWKESEGPTAEQVKTNGDKFDTTGKWVNYYELNEGYGDAYSEAVVYIYNLPDTKYATEFYVCSEIVLNDNTSELSDVVCRSMEGVALSAINSGEYEVAKLGNYLEEVDYQVNNYLRTVYGNYEKTSETSTVTGYAGLNVNYATGDEVDGYTYNANLTKLGNENFVIEEDATLNAYYENDAYKFETQSFAVFTTSTITKKALTGFAATDMQANTYEVVQTAADGYPEFWVSYPEDKVGEYLVMSLYYTKKSSAKGLGGWYFWSSKDTSFTHYAYSDEGKLLPSLTPDVAQNKWVNAVVQVPNTDDNKLKITLSQYATDSWYLGEYTFISEEEFKANFEQVSPVDTSIAGVTHYKGTSVVNTESDVVARYYDVNSIITVKASASNGVSYNSLKINGFTSYTPGQYVIARIMPSVNNASLVQFPGSAASMIYTESGEPVATPTAYSWYYYVWRIDVAGNANRWTYCFRMGTTDYAFFSDVYVANDATAAKALLAKKGVSSELELPLHKALPTEGVTTYAPSTYAPVSGTQNRLKSATTPFGTSYATVITQQAAGWWTENRMYAKGATFADGQYVVLETMITKGVLQPHVMGGVLQGYYEKATGNKVDKPELGKMYLMVYKLDQTAKAGEWGYVGQFGFFDGAAVGETAYVGNMYVFQDATTFNTWIGA